MSTQFDVIVIGAGPGGYVAAIRAAQLGLKTLVVEREHLGGICLNWGCIPTKALLRSAEIFHYLKNADKYGLSAKDIGFDINLVVKRSRNVAKQLSSGVAGLLKKNKVEVKYGHAKLGGKSRGTGGDIGSIIIEKDGTEETLKAKHIIIATGARAKIIPNMEPDGKLIWSYKEALVATEVPKKLAVIGSGAIGIEFASFFNTLGSNTTVIEMLEIIMPAEDKEISAFAGKSFEKQNMKILTKTQVIEIKKQANTATLILQNELGKTEELVVDKIISAVGVVANIENIGLETTKIQVDKGRIKVNEWLETNETGVYAIGDVIDGPWLAHKASHEAILCIEKIAGIKNLHPINKRLIPGCTYCHPQVASIGLTEDKAKELGYRLKIGRFPFIGNGKAIALGETEGLIKTIFDEKTGEFLGAHMIGTEVTELIQGYGVAMNLETTEQELMHTIFAHPTLSEMMHESVLQAYGKAIHI